MSDVVIFVRDLLGCTDRARCSHCKHRLLYSRANKDNFDDSRFICLAHSRKFINGRAFACSDFEPRVGRCIVQSNVQLNLQL